MRSLGVWSLVCLLSATGSVTAEVGLREVCVTTAEVRAGPGDGDVCHITNRLPRGTRVEVVGEATGGWLKIRPPADSVSWVAQKQLSRFGSQSSALGVGSDVTEVPVYIGEDTAGKPCHTVIGAKLKPGALFVSCGATVLDPEGEWLPVQPPEAEVRYIRTADLRETSSVTLRVARGKIEPNSPTVPPAPVVAKAGPVPCANLGPSAEHLWLMATQAQEANRLEEAARLYQKAAVAARGLNPRLQERAQQLAAQLASRNNSASDLPTANPGIPTPRPGMLQPINVAGRGMRLQAVPAQHATARLGAPTHAVRAPNEDMNRSPVVAQKEDPASAPSVAPATPVRQGELVYRGRIRQSGRTQGFTYLYRMESYHPGSGYCAVCYLTAEPGLNLALFLNENLVEVCGSVHYSGNLRAYLMTARSVIPLR